MGDLFCRSVALITPKILRLFRYQESDRVTSKHAYVRNDSQKSREQKQDNIASYTDFCKENVLIKCIISKYINISNNKFFPLSAALALLEKV